MSLQSYDPIQPGKESIVNTPYQHWQGKTTDRDATYIEFIINEIVYTAAVDAQGNWEFRLPVPLAEGGHNLTARFFDASGNAGAPIQTRVVVDISAPEQPQILTVFDDEGAVTGPVGNQGFTDDNTPTLRGFAEPDSIVRVYSNGTLLGSVQAGKNGQWSYEPTLNDGEHRLYITAADQFGQVSEESPVYTLFINESRVSRPQLLEVYDNQGADQGIINAGEISDDRNPRLSGSAALDAEFVVIYANGVRVGVAAVNNGYWQWESPLTQLALGENTLTVRAMNNKGEFSDPSDPFTYTVVAPVPTVIEYALDDVGAVQGQLESGGVTDDFSPLLVGSAEVNSLVYIYATRENGSWVLKGSVQADAAGYWQYEVPALSGGAGLYHFQASATATRDPNAPQFDLWVSASATTLKPVIEYATDDTGSVTGDVSNNGSTDDRTPTLKGTGVPGAVIEIQYGKKHWAWGAAGTAIVDADGNWTFTSPELTSTGVWEYRARTVNGAENSDWTDKFVLNVVESADAVIEYALDDAGAVQGQLESGGVTDDFRPVLVGSAEANSLVYIYATHENGSWVLKGSVKADAAGNWQYEVPRLSGGEGLYHFQASATATRDPNAPQFDLWVSASATTLKPVIEYATDDTGSVTGDVSNNGSTDDRTPTLKGTGVPGAVIEIQYGKKHWAWGAAGTAIVDADGNWTFTSPELTSTGVWEYRARTVNGAENSDWTGKFVLNVVESADAVIEYALDDVGAVRGQLESGGVTDDFRPVLVGSAEANSLVYIYATHENGSWVLKGSVRADAAGNWQYEVPTLSGGEGLYHFQVSATATRDPNAPQFDLWVSTSATTLKPVIEYATDDAGSVTVDVSNNGITDDKTPTLKGTGVPGAVIEIQYGKKHLAWGAAGTAIVDADGNWTFTSPALTSNGVWEYRARTVNGAENSAWTDKFVLNVVESVDVIGTEGKIWDFNDGTLQGWKKYGKYNLGNEIQVKPWSGGSYEVGSYTNDKTTSGYNGDVIYREVLVEKGQVYQFEFDARRLENHYAAPKLGIKVDGQEVIPHTTLNGGWQHLVGYYVATETKVVRVAVNSGVATGSGNDFTLDNIGIKPLAPADKETFDLNPDGKSDYFEFTLNKTYTLSSGLKLQMTVASSNNYKDMREGYLELGRSSHTKLILDEGASKIKMTLSNVHKSGNYIDFYDTAGHLLATRELPVYDADKVFEYQAPEGKSIGYARVRVASNEDDGLGESGGVIIRDVQWDSNAASSLNGVSGHDDAPSLLNAEHIALADLIDQQSDSHAVDLTNGTQNTLDVDMATLLQHGEENLFIEDGKTQMRITGDSEDTVRLDTLLDGQTAEGTWVQQNGTLTVAGVAYNVYSHSGAEVEVLVQEGVKTEFM